uniref:Pentatricopeptide repeat-containing protein n=1 Tax=Leersia perrieri TaxID=77586 RepID=A0A0D9WCP9_9ORYZ
METGLFLRYHSGILSPGMQWIGGYAHIGDARNAHSVFDDMVRSAETAPNYTTLVNVITASSRGGMEGRAYEVIHLMPMRPSISVWGALLGVCKMHGKTELGRIAAEKLFELDPQDYGNHVLHSTMFASAGR